MIDLDDIYRGLARPWTHMQLETHYHEAEASGAQLDEGAASDLARALPNLAIAVPPTSTLSVAVHLLHALPEPLRGDLPRQLLDTAQANVAKALHRCHRALELDGVAHGYTTDEWLPVVYDIAAEHLAPARLEEDPPTFVRLTQDAVSWLSRALVALDQETPEATAALADVLGRLLAVRVFAAVAHVAAGPGRG